MKMERKKQNLILFYEENNDEKDISSKLVRLYMNRFLIGEEDQSELSGVYDLAQNTQPNEDTPLVEFSSIWNQKESKRNGFGKTVFLKSVSKIFESEKMANRSRRSFPVSRAAVDSLWPWLVEQMVLGVGCSTLK